MKEMCRIQIGLFLLVNVSFTWTKKSAFIISEFGERKSVIREETSLRIWKTLLCCAWCLWIRYFGTYCFDNLIVTGDSYKELHAIYVLHMLPIFPPNTIFWQKRCTTILQYGSSAFIALRTSNFKWKEKILSLNHLVPQICIDMIISYEYMAIIRFTGLHNQFIADEDRNSSRNQNLYYEYAKNE